VPSDPSARTLEDVLDAARARITRLDPHQAQAAMDDGALLVDIRGDLSRAHDGIVPGSVHVPRTVLEWRLDPNGPWRNRHIAADRRLVVICDHGFSSVLAAASLVELGFSGTADVVGGYEAWRLAGLPTARAPDPQRDGELPGMAPPDGAPVSGAR
jgi:rhodanese-related sulfurtransferase